jgi:hypothetical protein
MKRISHSCCQSSYIILLLLVILCLILYIYSNHTSKKYNANDIQFSYAGYDGKLISPYTSIREIPKISTPTNMPLHTTTANWTSHNINEITPIYSISPPISDPYIPPLKRNMESPFPPFPPISTQNTTCAAFTQVGVLTNHDEAAVPNPKILPLMGRKWRRDKYQYYTVSNEGTKNMKLNIIVHGKNGLNENGVDMLYDKDVVYIPSFKKRFHVEIYDNMDFIYS